MPLCHAERSDWIPRIRDDFGKRSDRAVLPNIETHRQPKTKAVPQLVSGHTDHIQHEQQKEFLFRLVSVAKRVGAVDKLEGRNMLQANHEAVISTAAHLGHPQPAQ